MALVIEDKQFVHMLRVLNTNLEGGTNVVIALARIRGVGRRLANLVCKKADIDLKKRAGELTEDELNTIRVILANPQQFNIPKWFLNRQKDPVTGTWSQLVSNAIDTKLRDDLERMKRIRLHRGIRHAWQIKVRGQHTKTTGRRGKTVGVAGRK